MNKKTVDEKNVYEKTLNKKKTKHKPKIRKLVTRNLNDKESGV